MLSTNSFMASKAWGPVSGLTNDLDLHIVEDTAHLLAGTAVASTDEGSSEPPSTFLSLTLRMGHEKQAGEQDVCWVSKGDYISSRNTYAATAHQDPFHSPFVSHEDTSFCSTPLSPNSELWRPAHEDAALLPMYSTGLRGSGSAVDHDTLYNSYPVPSMHQNNTSWVPVYEASYSGGAASSYSPPWNHLDLRGERGSILEEPPCNYSGAQNHDSSRGTSVFTTSYTRTITPVPEPRSHGLSRVTLDNLKWLHNYRCGSKSDFPQPTPASRPKCRVVVPFTQRASKAKQGSSFGDNRLCVPTNFDACSCVSSQDAPSRSITSSHESEVLFCLHDGCPIEFRGKYRRGNLQRHMRLKHGKTHGQEEKEYSCEASNCSKVYMRQDARLKHYRKVHPQLNASIAVRRK